MTVTKKDFIQQLADEKHYTKKAAKQLVDDFWDMLVMNIREGNTVSFHGYGTFDIVERAPRMNRSVRTGEFIMMPPHLIPRFYAGETIRRAVRTLEDDRQRGLI